METALSSVSPDVLFFSFNVFCAGDNFSVVCYLQASFSPSICGFV